MKIRDWIGGAVKLLTGSDIECPRLEAEIICAHVMHVTRERLLCMPQDSLPRESVQFLNSLLARRLQHEPVSYIIGHKEFYGIDLKVDRRVLIPRPETELLVDLVLEVLALHPLKKPLIVDVGTGSGAIATAIAYQYRDPCIIAAIDSSFDALTLANENFKEYGFDWIFCMCGDVLAGIRSEVDIIVSNPPYVSEQEWQMLMPDVRDYEPRMALVAGHSGLEVIEQLMKESPEYLKPRGWLIFEIAPHQCDGVALFASQLDVYATIEFHPDLAGHIRAVKLQKKG